MGGSEPATWPGPRGSSCSTGWRRPSGPVACSSGDAARTHSPAGAQGRNSGIQDASNLAGSSRSPRRAPPQRRCWTATMPAPPGGARGARVHPSPVLDGDRGQPRCPAGSGGVGAPLSSPWRSACLVAGP
ncbi:MAG TPA: FAD-dependent monooxygenase, partial [Actinomycetes bacterium]|nr:FAD-dependent monooxygenase [Actinomycetes bacterium]